MLHLNVEELKNELFLNNGTIAKVSKYNVINKKATIKLIIVAFKF